MTSPLYCILVCIPGRQEGWSEDVLFFDQVYFLNRKIKCLITGWGSLRADEIKLWLTPSAKQRRNPCSGFPAVFPDLSTHYDWPVKKGLCVVCRDRQ